jgi:hypothetical protein
MKPRKGKLKAGILERGIAGEGDYAKRYQKRENL